MTANAQNRPTDPTAVKKGDVVGLVLSDGRTTPVDVINVRDAGLIDIEFIFNGEPMTITSSPHDATKKKPDSWHTL